MSDRRSAPGTVTLCLLSSQTFWIILFLLGLADPEHLEPLTPKLRVAGSNPAGVANIRQTRRSGSHNWNCRYLSRGRRCGIKGRLAFGGSPDVFPITGACHIAAAMP